MDDFIGPRKPAWITVKTGRFVQITAHLFPQGRTIDNLDDDTFDAFSAWEKRLGIVEWDKVGDGLLRITFIDDMAAAEFALRYA